MRRWLAALFLLICSSAASAQSEPGAVLIFSHTSGYRHDSIPEGIAAIAAIAGDRGLSVEKSEDPAVFSSESLDRFRAVVLLNTTTDPKDPASEWLVGDRRVALKEFVARGGGILAVHAAADSHYHWPWYAELVGGRFAGHPPGTPTGQLTILPDPDLNRGLPGSIERADEWYYFDDLDPGSNYLMTLDPGSIEAKDVNPNPLAWTRQVDGGRMFYTAMGHTKESYSEPFFLQHLSNGLEWVLSGSSSEQAEGAP